MEGAGYLGGLDAKLHLPMQKVTHLREDREVVVDQRD
jgi:hypothetical protein